MLAALLCLAFVVGCGGGDGAATTTADAGSMRLAARTEATLVLDFLPNAVHAGIYRAVAAGYYEDNNLDLRIVRPASTADTLKLIDAGKADVGLADSVDVMQQIAMKRKARAIMAVTQRPLGGLITRSADRLTPRRLAGRKVGLSGVPSDRVVLDTILRSAGLEPGEVKTVTIGFAGVQNLVSGSIDAFIGYYPADAAQVEAAGTPVQSFPFDQFGGPRYPGLVAFTAESRISKRPDVLRAIVDATVRGYEDVIERPEQGIAALLGENRELDRGLTRAQLRAYLPLFTAKAPAFGFIRDREVADLSAFLVRSGLIDAPVAANHFATDFFLPDR
ncbi:MAG: ABC transporter substrate-binding protein [Baekduia sp.]